MFVNDDVFVQSSQRGGAVPVFIKLSLSDNEPHPPLVSYRRHRRLLSDHTGKRGGEMLTTKEREGSSLSSMPSSADRAASKEVVN